jgi:putative transposase
MKIPFEGRLRWFDAQGRLEIRIEDNKLYAHIPVDVGRITAMKETSFTAKE